MKLPGALVLLAAAAAPAAAPAAAQDAAQLERGEQAYGQCMGCHSIEHHRTGPAHCGLFGRRAATAPGYDMYSDALKKSGIVWSEQTLQRFLADPMGVVPGTSMTYLGVTDPAERAALVAWLARATRGCRVK